MQPIYDARLGNRPGSNDLAAHTQRPGQSRGAMPAPAEFGIDPATLQTIRSWIDPEQFQQIVAANYKPGSLIQIPFTVGAAAQMLIPKQEGRKYLFVLNTSAVNRIFLGFGFAPSAVTGVVLEINLGFYEPNVVPNQEIWALGAGAGTTGVLIYAAG
jgi:hypothetical protein